MKGNIMNLSTETLEQFATDSYLLLSPNLITFANMVSQAVAREIRENTPKVKAKPKVSVKTPALPDNWRGNGRYKLLDKATNTHFDTDFETALIYKGLTAKKAFAVKRDLRDRHKEFSGRDTMRMAANNDVQGYVRHWLQDNNLVVGG
jgi:hypothetical protein